MNENILHLVFINSIRAKLNNFWLLLFVVKLYSTYLSFCLYFCSKGKVGRYEVHRLRTRLFAPSENGILKHEQFDFEECLKWYLRSITSSQQTIL